MKLSEPEFSELKNFQNYDENIRWIFYDIYLSLVLLSPAMKKILIIAIFILFATGVYAQTGMPKELTCTEEAFNFSISMGSKWKFSAPKMGPAEITRTDPGYTPEWSLKASNVKPETYMMPIFEKLPNTVGASYATYQLNNVLLSYLHSVKVMDKFNYTIPGVDFNFPTLRPVSLLY